MTIFLLIGLFIAGCGQKPTASPAPENPAANETPAPKENKEKITLTYAFFAPANTFPAVQMQKWADELSARTDGQVEVQLFPGGTLLDAANMYEGVRNGVADIGLSVTTYEPGIFPLHAISDFPSGYPNAFVASKVAYDLYQEFPPEAFADMKLLTAFATEPHFVQTKAAINTLEDLKGKQLRIAGSLTPIAQALGAAPVGLSQAEVPEALSTGVIEGYVTSREILFDMKTAEFIKYSVDYPLTINTFAAVMTKDTWDSLPENVQKVIEQLGPEMAEFTGKYLDEQVQVSIDWATKEHGFQMISLTPEEKERWDAIVKPIQENYVEEMETKGLPAKEYKKRLDELIEKYK